MKEMNFVTPLHTRTSRDYVGRVVENDKAECAEVACQFGKDYWDGDRKYGYGGYHYDGRWSVVAQAMIDHYQLGPHSSILDVGCGKAFLLHEFKKILPQATVAGVDISQYGLDNAKEEVRPFLQLADATELPFENQSFDLVISLGALHNLPINQLVAALRELERVKKGNAYMMVEAYRNEREKANLLYWQLTCKSFYHHDDWIWLFEEYGYNGDYEFIYFE